MNRLQKKYGTLYKVSELASYLGMSDVAIYKWCNKGRLGTKIGGSWRITESQIADLLEPKEFKKFIMQAGKKRNINSLLNKSKSIT